MPSVTTTAFPTYTPSVSDHVNRAVSFYQNYVYTSMWIGIGNPSSGSWQSPYSDTNPPIPATNSTALDNPIGYVQSSGIYLIYPSTTGTILYNGSYWAQSTVADAQTNEAYYVLIQASIVGNNLPVGEEYREVGAFYNLVPASGQTSTSLVPSQVSSPGTLLVIDYRGPTLRQSDQTEDISLLLQM